MSHLFEPIFIHRELTAPALLETSYDNDGTSYSAMSEWLRAPGQGPSPPRPLVNMVTQPQRDLAAEEEQKQPTEPPGPEDKYKRIYNSLTNQIAYRYPNPGSPRFREGAIGGTWRHIKEVLSHGGSRVCFVDGLVSVYDNAQFTEKLQAQLPYRPHIKPLFAPTMGDVTPRAMRATKPMNPHPILPSLPQASLQRDPNVERKMQLQERFSTDRKGIYYAGGRRH